MTNGRWSRREALKLAGALALTPTGAYAQEASMLRREIPGAGESLPVIGLGTYEVFDMAGSREEIATRRDIVATLVEHGGEVIDTSPMYNRSERIIGEVLDAGGFRERCFIATKVWTDGKAAGEAQMRRSAELMGTDTIDLMQVHNRRDLDTHMGTIRDWKADGRIRYSGVTDYRDSSHAAMERIMADYEPDFIQINYSLGERAAADRLLPAARDLGVAVLVNRPFVAGRLFRAVGDRPVPDWAREFAASWGQFFLKYIVAHPAVTCVIPATSKFRHMRDNVQAGFGRLPDSAERGRMAEFVDAL